MAARGSSAGMWYFVPDPAGGGPAPAMPAGGRAGPPPAGPGPVPGGPPLVLAPPPHAAPAVREFVPPAPPVPPAAPVVQVEPVELTTTDHTGALADAMQIDGALGAVLVDSGSGMALATAGGPVGIDLDVAAAGNSSVMHAVRRALTDLSLHQSVEDVLITLDKQFHVIRPLARQDDLFLYLVLDRARSNLGMARFQLAGIERSLRL
jgi:hypothetical protein